MYKVAIAFLDMGLDYIPLFEWFLVLKIIPEFGDPLIEEFMRGTEDTPWHRTTTVPKDDSDFTLLGPARQEIYFQVEIVLRQDGINCALFYSSKATVGLEFKLLPSHYVLLPPISISSEQS